MRRQSGLGVLLGIILVLSQVGSTKAYPCTTSTDCQYSGCPSGSCVSTTYQSEPPCTPQFSCWHGVLWRVPHCNGVLLMNDLTLPPIWMLILVLSLFWTCDPYWRLVSPSTMTVVMRAESTIRMWVEVSLPPIRMLVLVLSLFWTCDPYWRLVSPSTMTVEMGAESTISGWVEVSLPPIRMLVLVLSLFWACDDWLVVQCPDPPVCNAGSFSPDGKNAGGDKACQLCPSGKFQTSTGSSSSIYLNLTVTALTMTIPVMTWMFSLLHMY